MNDTKEMQLKIGLALNHIAMALDDATYKRIKPQLDVIEKTVLELTEEKNEGSKDAENEPG